MPRERRRSSARKAGDQPRRKRRRAAGQALEADRAVHQRRRVDPVEVVVDGDSVAVARPDGLNRKVRVVRQDAPRERVGGGAQDRRLHVNLARGHLAQVRVVEDDRVRHGRIREPVPGHHLALDPHPAPQRIDPPIGVMLGRPGKHLESGHRAVAPGVRLDPRGRDHEALHEDHPVAGDRGGRFLVLLRTREGKRGHRRATGQDKGANRTARAPGIHRRGHWGIECRSAPARLAVIFHFSGTVPRDFGSPTSTCPSPGLWWIRPCVSSPKHLEAMDVMNGNAFSGCHACCSPGANPLVRESFH